MSSNEQVKDFALLILDVLNAFKFSQEQGTVGIDLIIPAGLIAKGANPAK